MDGLQLVFSKTVRIGNTKYNIKCSSVQGIHFWMMNRGWKQLGSHQKDTGWCMDAIWMILTRMNADRNTRERERGREEREEGGGGSEDKTQNGAAQTHSSHNCVCVSFTHNLTFIFAQHNRSSEAAMATAMRILHASSSVVTCPQAFAGPAPPQQSTFLRCAWKGKAVVRVPAFAASPSQLGNIKKSARCSFGPSGGTGG